MKRVLCILGLVAVLGGCGGPDLDDPATLDRILAEAVDEDELQERGAEGEELYYVSNKQTPYSGWTKRMYSSGQVSELAEIKEGKRDGVAMKWYSDGQKQAQAAFKDGKPYGQMLGWHKNGQKAAEASFKDGEMEGVARRWDEDGKLTKEVQYENGEEISEKEFF